MAKSLTYKLGSLLGRIMVVLFIVSIILSMAASIAAVHVQFGLTGPLLWFGTIAVCALIVWLLPLGYDVLALVPLAALGASKGWGLPWMVATALVLAPALLVFILSRLYKED